MGLLTPCEDPPEAVASVFGAVLPPLSAVSPGRMTSVCGEDPGFFCREVLNRTNDRGLAELSDKLPGTTLTIILIFVGALIASRIIKRTIKRTLRTLHSGAVR